MVSFNSYTGSVRKIVLFVLFYRWVQESPERVSNLLKVTQLVNKAGFEPTCLVPELMHLPHCAGRVWISGICKTTIIWQGCCENTVNVSFLLLWQMSTFCSPYISLWLENKVTTIVAKGHVIWNYKMRGQRVNNDIMRKENKKQKKNRLLWTFIPQFY